jgi:hypothetical protein
MSIHTEKKLSPLRALILIASLATSCLGITLPSAAADAPQSNSPSSSAKAAPEQPLSPAEIRLFMSEQLKNLPARDSVLNYKFTKTGAYEAGYEDKVVLQVGAPDTKAEGARKVTAEFMTGDHKTEIPPVENAHGNPVIMFFLERDVREMKRITGGSPNYYRKLIRLALVDTKEVKPITAKWGGKEIKAEEIVIDPFKDDPAKSRYTRFANKTYSFIISDQVPGNVLSMKTVMREGGSTGKVMIEENLTLTENK